MFNPEVIAPDYEFIYELDEVSAVITFRSDHEIQFGHRFNEPVCLLDGSPQEVEEVMRQNDRLFLFTTKNDVTTRLAKELIESFVTQYQVPVSVHTEMRHGRLLLVLLANELQIDATLLRGDVLFLIRATEECRFTSYETEEKIDPLDNIDLANVNYVTEEDLLTEETKKDDPFRSLLSSSAGTIGLEEDSP